jgi:hypothetical protein
VYTTYREDAVRGGTTRISASGLVKGKHQQMEILEYTHIGVETVKRKRAKR